MRESQLTGRLRLRHLHEVTEAIGEEMEIERERFERLKDPTSQARAVSAFNLFQTPVELADRIAAMAHLEGRVLEPSAGLGRIFQAIRNRSDCHVTMVEIAPQCCRELFAMTEGDGNASLVQADFLECDAERLGGLFDGIVMNPPFKMGRDIKHIEHAATLLAPSGKLVAICAAGPRQRARFQDRDGWTWEDLPPGSFKESYTNVAAAVVTFEYN